MKTLIIASVVVVLLALACGEEEGITRPRIPVINPVYPADVLENVETSFIRRDIDLLKKCLSPDFVFYFDPNDVGQNPPGSIYVIPESWSYTEFWLVARNMFNKTYAINLSIPTGGVGTPGPGETRYKAENVSISLLVMVDERNGYIADNGYCNFAFEVYYNEQKEKRWRLSGWWDFTNEYADATPGLIPTSLGRILAMYK
jgi:hypothetical protein